MSNNIKKLWDIYRYGKAYASISELLLEKKVLSPKELLPEYNAEMAYIGLPPAGSEYYLTTIDPPLAFIREITADKISMEGLFKQENAFNHRGNKERCKRRKSS